MIQAARRPVLVVVGTGMAGAKVVEEILAREPDRFEIRMFGGEPNGTYNRILLSHVLGGHQDLDRLWLNTLDWYDKRGVYVHSGVLAERIDLDKRVVIGGDGRVEEPYDYLVFATGSRPFVPPMEGSKQRGVFVFRTLEDCASIGAYAKNCDRAIVIGGGLLGLEAARGLMSHDLEVTVVEVAPQLMIQQLDPAGGALLKRKLEDMGVEVLLEKQTAEILSENGQVSAIRFKDGTVRPTDMVVISCGIRPNSEIAKSSGVFVDRAIVIDDQMRTSQSDVFAVGECAQHRGKVYGLVDPVYEQARILADVLTEKNTESKYEGSRLGTTLKVMGVDLLSMGEVTNLGPECEVVTHTDPAEGIYKKIVIRDRKLVGAILLGVTDPTGRLLRLFKEAKELHQTALELIQNENTRDSLLESGDGSELMELAEDSQICNCHGVTKKDIVDSIRDEQCTIAAIGNCTRAGTGCGTCQPIIGQLISLYAPAKKGGKETVNKLEVMKSQQDGLDSLPRLLELAENNNWQEMTEDDKQRAKWYGLFFRKPTPGNFMLRLRMEGGRTNAQQLRVIADLSDQYGKGFSDLTTRQQIQLRWFTLGDVPDIWERLQAVGLHTKQTGLDNMRGVCGCPVSGVTPHELVDAAPVIKELDSIIVDNKEFTNLPRKFNVTITGCLENCCHPETQDIGLVPAFREIEGRQVNGFNILVGGKQGSGGYRPATPLDVFVSPDEAASVCADMTRVFRDFGSRATRVRARLAFLIEDKGVSWFRSEVVRRVGHPLHKAGQDMRKKNHADHIGLHPQKRPHGYDGPDLYYIGFVVPVGRITTAQMRAVAEVADAYGNGDVRVTTSQNLVIPNIPEDRIGALTDEPIFKELPFDPSPIMRGLVACTGIDYCGLALIETKGYAIEVAKELERRTAGRKIQPLTIHWSGCPASCGMHQVSTIGLQGCRSRINGQVVDAAHVFVKGSTGPHPVIATDLMYDVPCDRLADALEPLVVHLPR